MYIKLVDGSPVEYNVRDLRKEYPNVSFPKEPSDELLAEYDIYPVVEADQPAFS